MEAQRIRRRYDHRLQQLVHETGDIKLAVRHGVPRSTARDWCVGPSKLKRAFGTHLRRQGQGRGPAVALRAGSSTLDSVLPYEDIPIHG